MTNSPTPSAQTVTASNDGDVVTVKVPDGYDSVWDFLNDCGLESVSDATLTSSLAAASARNAELEQSLRCISTPVDVAKLKERIEELEVWQRARLETFDMDTKRIVELEEALRPFAEIAQFVTDTQRDTRPIVFGLDNVIAQRLTIGHLRKARAALSQTEEGR